MKTRTIVLAVVLLALLAASSALAQTAPLYIKQFGSDNYDYPTETTTLRRNKRKPFENLDFTEIL